MSTVCGTRGSAGPGDDEQRKWVSMDEWREGERMRGWGEEEVRMDGGKEGGPEKRMEGQSGVKEKRRKRTVPCFRVTAR